MWSRLPRPAVCAAATGQALRLPGLCPLAEEGVGGGNKLLHLQAQPGTVRYCAMLWADKMALSLARQ